MIWALLTASFLSPAVAAAIVAFVERQPRPPVDWSWPGKPLRFLDLEPAEFSRVGGRR